MLHCQQKKTEAKVTKHFGHKTLRHHHNDTEVHGQFDTGAEMSRLERQLQRHVGSGSHAVDD